MASGRPLRAAYDGGREARAAHRWTGWRGALLRALLSLHPAAVYHSAEPRCLLQNIMPVFKWANSSVEGLITFTARCCCTSIYIAQVIVIRDARVLKKQ